VPAHRLDDSLDQRVAGLGRGLQRFAIGLLNHRGVTNVLWKGREGKRRFKFLRVSRKPVRLQVRLCEVGRQKVPVRVELQIDLEPLLKLAPDAHARRDVSTVTIEHQDVFESGVMHAANGVVQHAEPTSGHCRQRTRMAHVMLTDPDVEGGSDQHAGSNSLGNLGGNVEHAPPIVLHRQMLEVLLRRCYGDDAAR